MDLIKLSRITPSESIIAKSMERKDIIRLMQWGFSNLCSDGAPRGHPRGWGAFPRYLRMDTGEDLATKIHKMTAQAAENLNLKDIGLIKPGYYADLLLFDSEKIEDKATYKNNAQKAQGIAMLMVSGQIVYQDKKASHTFSGRVIKRN